MFTITQRLLLTQPVSLPTCCQCHSANPIHPRHSPAHSSRGLERGRDSLNSTLSPAPKPERARQCQLLQMCLPPPCPCWGTELGLGPDPQLPALQPLSWGEGAIVRPKEELRNVLFICVCDQGAPPHTQIYGLVFHLYIFHTVNFLYKPKEKI